MEAVGHRQEDLEIGLWVGKGVLPKWVYITNTAMSNKHI